MPDPDSRQLHGAQIAYRIRAELVCCNIYQRVQDGEVQHPEVNGSSHTLCYWGEASARIAEDPGAWQDDPDECAQGCPPQCRHQRGAGVGRAMTDSPVADADVNSLAPIGFTPGAPRPDDADWNSPEDASYDQHQEQQ